MSFSEDRKAGPPHPEGAPFSCPPPPHRLRGWPGGWSPQEGGLGLVRMTPPGVGRELSTVGSRRAEEPLLAWCQEPRQPGPAAPWGLSPLTDLAFLRFSQAGWARAEVPAGSLQGGQAQSHTGRTPGPRPIGPIFPSSSPQESFNLFLGQQSDPDVSPNRGRAAACPSHSATGSRPGPWSCQDPVEPRATLRQAPGSRAHTAGSVAPRSGIASCRPSSVPAPLGSVFPGAAPLRAGLMIALLGFPRA